ncbi:thioredoxin family protein [Rhodohalobacter sp. SW132]|uniref:thioredoxin family protein n=1 Tax=Rhodohalobacter sp. SW132 TaxID=2293433 RepID=UPI000E24493A|nr:thioredoxin family protein [Rhodohalobacter sp. SW132]REL32801.1 thioredoxin family protein [Rhodohalobacter sp. SW132]
MTEVKNRIIPRELIDEAYTYEQYREMIDRRLEEGKTTGENHSEAMLHYTNMNVHRMKRHDKRTDLTDKVIEKLQQVDRNWIWLVLTEAWCGDAAQSIPIISKMAEESENIDLRLILRDENLDVMDEFLHNGKSRSIPKLICLDADTLEVLGSWGPRPHEAQEMYDTLRGSSEVAYQEVAEHLHKWYADDKGNEIQQEFYYLIDEWERA